MSRRIRSYKSGQSVHLFFSCRSLTAYPFPAEKPVPFRYYSNYVVVPVSNVQGTRIIHNYTLSFGFQAEQLVNTQSARFIIVKLPRGFVLGPDNFYVNGTSYDFQPQNSIVYSGIICSSMGFNQFKIPEPIALESDEYLDFILLTQNSSGTEQIDYNVYVDSTFNISY